MGHKDAWTMPDGRVRVDLASGNPVYFPDEISAFGGMAAHLNEEAAAAKFVAEVDHMVSSGTVKLGKMTIDSSTANIARVLGDIPIPPPKAGVLFRGFHGHEDPSSLIDMFRDGRAILRRDGGPEGIQLDRNLEVYHTIYERLMGKYREARRKFVSSTGNQQKYSTRDIESGKVADHASAYDQTLGHYFNGQYANAADVGADIGPKVEGRYVAHVNDFAEAMKKGSGKLGNEFIQQLIHEGIADTPKAAYHQFMETGGFVAANEDKMLDRMGAKNGKSRVENREILKRVQDKAEVMAHNLQTERTGSEHYTDDLLYATDLAARRNARLIAETAVFGKNAVGLKNLIDSVDKRDPDLASRLLYIANAERGKVYAPIRNFTNGWTTAARVRFALAPLQHIPQVAFPWVHYGFPRVLKGMGRLLRNSFTQEGRERMRSFGAVNERLSDYFMNQETYQPRQGVIGKLSGWTNFVTAPLHHLVNGLRRYGFSIGESVYDELLPKAKAGNVNAIKMLNEMFSTKGDAAHYQNHTGPMEAEMRGIAGRYVADLTTGRFDPLRVSPELYKHEMVRMMLYGKQYSYSYTRFLAEELSAYRNPNIPKAVGIMRTARMLAFTGLLQPAYTVLNATIRDAIGAGNVTTAAVVKAWHKLMDDPNFSDYVAYQMASMSLGHTLGMLTAGAEMIGAGNVDAASREFGTPVGMAPLIDMALLAHATGVGVASYMSGNDAMVRYQAAKAAEAASRLVVGTTAPVHLMGIKPGKKPKS
jgi:hypothetical protein